MTSRRTTPTSSTAGPTPEFKGSFNDFGPAALPVDREALARGPMRNERNGELIVERLADGRPIGTVSWHLERYGPNEESGAWNVGIALIPDARGHGYGTEAQRLVADFLFATTPSTGSRRPPTSRTWPSSARSRRPASSARRSCAASSTGPGPGTTWSTTPGCATTELAQAPTRRCSHEAPTVTDEEPRLVRPATPAERADVRGDARRQPGGLGRGRRALRGLARRGRRADPVAAARTCSAPRSS